MHTLFGTALALGIGTVLAEDHTAGPYPSSFAEPRAERHSWHTGAPGTPYLRLAPANYADGLGQPVDGPNPRRVSNRIFADRAQNLFSETGVTQWVWAWGQFVDHSIGLRASGEEPLTVHFDHNDPLERFANDSDTLHVVRSAADPRTGRNVPREQLNNISSYLDAWAVYGGSNERLEWLREGPVDGDLTNNRARLVLTDDGHLPPASFRGDASSAPVMEREGHLRGAPDADDQAVIAGDIRANENVALTAVQTLFAREHNRIVDYLPVDWSEQRRFEVARLLVIATQQYITYEEFLPALGIELPKATRYQPDVDPSISNEFATVGYRAHSMIHGEIETSAGVDYYGAGQLESFRAQGIELAFEPTENDASAEMVELAVPLNIAFGNPQLVRDVGVGRIALGLAAEPQYRNDEQIDNQLRSVLFQRTSEGVEDPDVCLDGPSMPDCFALIGDIGVLDIVRGRDHGMPFYNDLREVYGLDRIANFIELTGEDTESFPTSDPQLDADAPQDDPASLDFIALFDADGAAVELGSEAADSDAVEGIRRTTLAARLKVLYGNVDRLDAFVGMVSEPHRPGSDFGELQHAMWVQQFSALRDGDPNFYVWNAQLERLAPELDRLDLDWRRRLADVVLDNTDVTADEVRPALFLDASHSIE